jgi:6-phosphogluconolactonase
MKTTLIIICTCLSNILFAQIEKKLVVGTYTKDKAEGIYLYNFNTKTADATLQSFIKTTNPSYLTIAPNNKFVYAVNEDADSTANGKTGYVSAFKLNEQKNELIFINKQVSAGAHPCYISITKNGKWVFVGNYSGGSVSVFPVEKDGSIGLIKQNIIHIGKSVNEQRQNSPHVHATVLSPDNKFLYVPDLGKDKIMIYRFDDENGKLKLYDSATTQAGSGPRHFIFNTTGNFAYLMEELSGNVICYAVKNGRLFQKQSISSLPKNYNGTIGCADIHISNDGKFLYTSNRGGESNTISIFSVNKSSGMLAFVDTQSTLGIKPRNFNFDQSGRFLLVANQSSNNIIIFSVNKITGKLSDTGKRIDVYNPVCLKWM